MPRVARIAARGRLRASEFVLAPLRFEKFDGQGGTGGPDDHNSQGAGGFLRRKKRWAH